VIRSPAREVTAARRDLTIIVVSIVGLSRLLDGPLTWADMPEAVQMHHLRVTRGEGIWAAWNAGFDRAIWNYATTGFPEMEPHQIIDVMAQGAASGLPPDLDLAAKMSGSTHKVESGTALIALFCTFKGYKGVEVGKRDFMGTPPA
jgi:hypothetical protein